MNADERRQLMARYELSKQRLAALEIEQATKGINTPPETVVEIGQIKKQLAEWDKQLHQVNGKTINLTEIGFDQMDMNERLEMVIKYLMLLQTDMREAMQHIQQVRERARDDILSSLQPDITRMMQRNLRAILGAQAIIAVVVVAVEMMVRR